MDWKIFKIIILLSFIDNIKFSTNILVSIIYTRLMFKNCIYLLFTKMLKILQFYIEFYICCIPIFNSILLEREILRSGKVAMYLKGNFISKSIIERKNLTAIFYSF